MDEKNNNIKHYLFQFETADDSLKNYLIGATNNKAAYYDEAAKIFRVIPANYVTDTKREMHYLFILDNSKKQLYENALLYKIKLIDSLPLKKIEYSVKKYSLINNEWVLKYDLGILKVQFLRSKLLSNDALRKDISIDIINTIAKDTYSQ